MLNLYFGASTMQGDNISRLENAYWHSTYDIEIWSKASTLNIHLMHLTQSTKSPRWWHCTIWKLQWGSGHRIFSIFRRKQRFHIVDPIQLSPHDVFSHFSTSNLVTSSCIYPSSSWESESPWYLVTACVRKNEVKYLIFNIFQTKNAFLGY